MDPNSERKFSFPNADQSIPGASGPYRPEQQPSTAQPRKVVNIMDALAAHKDGETPEDARTVRTYQADLADVIKNDNVSMIKIALAEKKRQENGRQSFDLSLAGEHPQGKVYFIVGGIFLFVIIVGLIGGFFYFKYGTTTEQTAEIQQPQYQPLVYTEVTTPVDTDGLDSNDILKQLALDKDGVMDLGTMKAEILTTGSGTSTRPLTTSEFFTALGTRAPDMLKRSLDPDFTLGVYAYTPREMFAIFKVKTYDAAFAGMLQWEPSIDSDIGEIFLSKKEQPASDTQYSSTTSATTTQEDDFQATSSIPFNTFTSNRTFVDRVLINKDARVLTDADGTPRMLYTFLDKQTLVLATSEKSLKEIIFRLTTGRIVR